MVEMTENFLMQLAGSPLRVLVRREKRKSLSIRVNGIGEVHAAAPNQMPLHFIEEFIIQKRRWIEKRLLRFELWRDWPISRRYEEGEPILFEGKSYPLVIKIQEGWSRCQVFLEAEQIVVWGPDANPEEIRKALVKWLVGESKKKIEERICKLARLEGFSFSAVTLGNGKTLWGTCRQDGLIRINWRAIFLPPQILDYILIHELCHCKELNHSSRFWAEVERCLPDWRDRRRKLKEYGVLLGEMRD